MSCRSMVMAVLCALTLGACKGTDKAPDLLGAEDSGTVAPPMDLPDDTPASDDETGAPPEDRDSGDASMAPDEPNVDGDGDGFTPAGGDCDDTDDEVYPDADEACDGIDNDCDGDIDNDAVDTQRWFADYDGDGFGHTDVYVDACIAPENMVGMPGDCDDLDPQVHPLATEVCDDIDNDCDGGVDGSTALDAILQFEDRDGDGFGNSEEVSIACFLLPEHVENDLDCADRDEAIHPDADEQCNGIDDNCNETVDEGFEYTVYYEDADGDQRGNAMEPTVACVEPDGFVANASDCDDNDRWIHGDMVELCDERDNDCDGLIDEDVGTYAWIEDLDGDGYGASLSGDVTLSCSVVPGRTLEDGDCDDWDDDVYPGAWERCNGIDDDCDGAPDDGLPETTYYMDADADGYGDPDVPQTACELPEGYSIDGDDCDDSDASVNPGIFADCEDGRDEDCDGEIDEGPDSTWFVDADGDGHGHADETVVSCLMPDGYAPSATDCDDTDPDVNPDARERCDDDLDGDCDGWGDDLDPDCDCPDHGIEEDDDMGESVGDPLVTGNSSTSDATVDGSCGSVGGRDDIFHWTAPDDGCYTFDTNGSTYDTVLRLFEPCDGVELSCNDDGGEGLSSLIQQGMERGQSLFVVVDAYSSGSAGDYALSITYEPSTSDGTELPYDEDLGDEIGDGLASGSNAGMGDDFDGYCGSSGGQDVAFLWEAPTSDCYIIDTEGASYDTVLRLFSSDGEAITCGADSSGELACDDDGGSVGLTSSIRYTFVEDAEYVIVVDGYSSGSSGTYTLDINPC